MVERSTSSGGLDEFVGTVENVVLEKNTFGETESDQYHITIKAEGVAIKGKTGLIHEWVKLSAKATQKSIPEGSIVERYLSSLEVVMPALKSAKTLDEAFSQLKGKKFLWRRVKLGRAFEGHPARDVWVPVVLK